MGFICFPNLRFQLFTTYAFRKVFGCPHIERSEFEIGSDKKYNLKRTHHMLDLGGLRRFKFVIFKSSKETMKISHFTACDKWSQMCQKIF